MDSLVAGAPDDDEYELIIRNKTTKKQAIVRSSTTPVSELKRSAKSRGVKRAREAMEKAGVSAQDFAETRPVKKQFTAKRKKELRKAKYHGMKKGLNRAYLFFF